MSKNRFYDKNKREFIKKGLLAIGLGGAAALLSKVGFVDADRRPSVPTPVASGGTGVCTITGIVKGNGASAMTAATAGVDYAAPLPANAAGALTNNGSGSLSWAASLPILKTVARSSNTQLTSAHSGYYLRATGSWTQTFDAASSLTDSFFCYIENTSTGEITVDPNGTELIDGVSTFVMYPGEIRIIHCDGSALYSKLVRGGYKVYNTPGAYTFCTPPNYNCILIDVLGGGGGGGGGAKTHCSIRCSNCFGCSCGELSYNSSMHGGAGGGSAARLCAWFDTQCYTVSGAINVCVGCGGSGGKNGCLGTVICCGCCGGSGQNSYFGTYCAYGGGGGMGGCQNTCRCCNIAGGSGAGICGPGCTTTCGTCVDGGAGLTANMSCNGCSNICAFLIPPLSYCSAGSLNCCVFNSSSCYAYVNTLGCGAPSYQLYGNSVFNWRQQIICINNKKVITGMAGARGGAYLCSAAQGCNWPGVSGPACYIDIAGGTIGGGSGGGVSWGADQPGNAPDGGCCISNNPTNCIWGGSGGCGMRQHPWGNLTDCCCGWVGCYCNPASTAGGCGSGGGGGGSASESCAAGDGSAGGNGWVCITYF